MASIIIRNLDEPLKARLRVRAAHYGRSMEDEVRTILKAALSRRESKASHNLAEVIQKRFKPLGGVELKEVRRDALRTPPYFEK